MAQPKKKASDKQSRPLMLHVTPPESREILRHKPRNVTQSEWLRGLVLDGLRYRAQARRE